MRPINFIVSILYRTWRPVQSAEYIEEFQKLEELYENNPVLRAEVDTAMESMQLYYPDYFKKIEGKAFIELSEEEIIDFGRMIKEHKKRLKMQN